MVAAENGALPNGKVGGVADVVRDLPPALADVGCTTTVITPEYGLFADLPDAKRAGSLAVPVFGKTLDVEIYEISSDMPGVRHIAFAHSEFTPHGPGIYCDDGPGRPFASDARKYALLAAATAEHLLQMETTPDVIHLHDWHAALFLYLRNFSPRYRGLRHVPCVYTIHNLALQGIRPLAGDPSSLTAFFPDVPGERNAVVDPRWADCMNPMAVGIRLADQVSTVSPNYAREILRPNDDAAGYRGGEGLEKELNRAATAGRLVGILNGCEYPKRDRRRPGWRRLLDTINREVYEWIVDGNGQRWIHEETLASLSALPKRRPRHLLTSIGRLTEQKAALFLERTNEGATAIEKILGSHARDTVLILLGSGDPHYQERFADIARHHRNFLFVCGYSKTFTDLLYRTGDLFLMPSSFEPCGISQMLAMRAAQPVVAHAVGGLADTVIDEKNGFTFDGHSTTAKAERFVETVSRAIAVRNDDQELWLKIRANAEAARFSWKDAAERYVTELYEAE